ncbi:MAG: 2-oxo acid dehydrogenase subunit E2 [bacterium]
MGSPNKGSTGGGLESVWQDINGVAVAVGKKGLIVLVIKVANQKSLLQVSKNVKVVAEKARFGTLKPEDVSGGTFTMSSVAGKGMSSYSTPMFNQPKGAETGPPGTEKSWLC